VRAEARGFTLVEVVVAIGILAVAVLPLIALMALGVQTNRESAQRSRAALMAESIFSELRQSSAETGAIVRVRSDGALDGQYWNAPKTAGALAGKAVYLAYDQDGQVVQEYGQGAY
jgi:general secretion pathway protein I